MRSDEGPSMVGKHAQDGERDDRCGVHDERLYSYRLGPECTLADLTYPSKSSCWVSYYKS